MATEELMKSLTESMILGVSKEVKPEGEPATVGLRPASSESPSFGKEIAPNRPVVQPASMASGSKGGSMGITLS
jgi:hypothetical protein